MITSDDVRKIRKANGWTQHQLAAAMDVSQPSIVRWEKQPPPQNGPTYKLLCALLRKAEAKKAGG